MSWSCEMRKSIRTARKGSSINLERRERDIPVQVSYTKKNDVVQLNTESCVKIKTYEWNSDNSNSSQTEDYNSLQIIAGACVCVEAEIRGDVKIGTKTIVHPCAKILATGGPIVIGDANIIEELATIENKSPETLFIGNNNVFEVWSTVMAKCIGDHNVFETKCFVGQGVVVGNGCAFGAGTKVTPPTSVLDNSVFFGDPLRHRVAGERPAAQALQIDFLGRILPNYHHVKNPTLKREATIDKSTSGL